MTLNELQDEFESWRANKISKNESIPSHLWDQVFLLKEQGYTLGQLSQQLSISGTQMTKQSMKRKQEQSNDFIEIPQTSSNTNSLLENNRCDINLNFDKKTINLNMTMTDLQQLLPKFKGLFQ